VDSLTLPFDVCCGIMPSFELLGLLSHTACADIAAVSPIAGGASASDDTTTSREAAGLVSTDPSGTTVIASCSFRVVGVAVVVLLLVIVQ
jgi:hypothetical protein